MQYYISDCQQSFCLTTLFQQHYVLVCALYRQCNLIRHQWRDGIADLIEPLSFISHKFKPIGETLQTGSFTMGDTPSPSIWQPHTLHIAGGSGQVTARYGSCRAVGIQITGIDATRRFFIFCYILVLCGSKETTTFGCCVHGVAYCLSHGHLAIFPHRELII